MSDWGDPSSWGLITTWDWVASGGGWANRMSDFLVDFDVAMTSNPRTASPSYTALEPFVMAGDGITASRGRGGEQSATSEPGSCQVTLKNGDGRFTMGNGSSPYAPLKLRRPGRLRVTHAGTTYDLWRGFVDVWGNARDQLAGRARLTLTDRTAGLVAIKLPTLLQAEILADSPLAFYPLDEAAGAKAAGDRSGNGGPSLLVRQVGYGGGLAFGAGSIATGDQTQAEFTPRNINDGKYLTVTNPNIAGSISGGGATLEAVVRLDDQATLSVPVVVAWTGAGAQRIQIGIDANLMLNQLGGGAASDGPGPYYGRLCHIAITITSAGVITYYVNGVAQGGATIAASSTMGDTLLVGADPSYSGTTFQGRVSHVAVFRSILSPSRISQHAQALFGFAGELTTDRFNRLCRLAGIPSALYATTGVTGVEVGPQQVGGRALSEVLSAVAKTELGCLFVNDAGVLTFATASSRYNQAVAVTLDASKPGHVLPDGVDFRTDTASLVNDSTATGVSGAAQRTIDATSTADYDSHDESETTLHAVDEQALNWTQWRVASFKDPQQRCESVTVDVVAYANSGGNVGQLLNAEIGQRLQLINMPSDMSPVSTVDLFIEGIRYEVTKRSLRLVFRTSPLALENTVARLGVSSLNSSAILGY